MASAEAKVALQDAENLTDFVAPTPMRMPSTPEGMAIAYGSLIIMAIVPIFFGSFRAVKHHKEQQQQYKDSGEQPDKITHAEAAMFPIISSITLISFYILYKLFTKEYINLILASYFFFLGILALCHLMSPLISSLVPAAIPKTQYHVLFTRGEGDKAEHIINYKFNLHDVVCLICCTFVGIWYFVNKHWIANNLFGIAFAINAVEILHVNNVVTGCILLGGLVFYDIFWVFGTDVMVTVANSFEVPIKVVFPQDLLEKGLGAGNFAILGLGDIVLPGIFIALLLRFDNSLNRKTNVYFYSTFFAYFVGLLTTISIMHVFNHAQPALLYLVPACLGTPLLLALVKGDLKTLFSYDDHPTKPIANKKDEQPAVATQSEAKKEK